MPQDARTNPEPVRCLMHQAGFDPVRAHYGMFTFSRHDIWRIYAIVFGAIVNL